jgi:hypothetical protein
MESECSFEILVPPVNPQCSNIDMLTSLLSSRNVSFSMQANCLLLLTAINLKKTNLTPLGLRNMIIN